MQRIASATFLRQVQRTIDRHEMLVAGDAVLVALSGGPDSTALLAALLSVADRYGIRIHAAHLNHRLRPDAERDQQWAQALAARLGVPCAVGTLGGVGGRSNLEARARQQRYRFLAEAADRHGCTKIATGHTLDDQAETFLMRLLRGAGVDGLGGIPAVREGYIIRPLIECSRAQVLQFLQERGLSFCDDPSNADRRFLRNRVRHEVLPLLEGIHPGVARRLAGTAAVAAAEAAWLEAHIAARLPAGDEDDGSLPVTTIVETPPALRGRLVRSWLRRHRRSLRAVAGVHVHAILEAALGTSPHAEIRLPGGGTVARVYDVLRLVARGPSCLGEAVQDLLPGALVQTASGWRLSARRLGPGDGGARPSDDCGMHADLDAVKLPLTVRAARPGDRIQPLGMRGHRKLQDIFVDRKVPRAARAGHPVVEMGGEIFWVPGVVRSSAAPITPATRAILQLLAEKRNVAGPPGVCYFDALRMPERGRW